MKHKVTCRAKRTSTVQMDQRGKTQELMKKKSRRGHGYLCCVCRKDGNMERKVT
jgi:hypothetical protein